MITADGITQLEDILRPNAPAYSWAMGSYIDMIWDEVYDAVASITYGAESVNAVKGYGFPINQDIRTYVMLGPCYMDGGRSATTTWWWTSFIVLLYYDEPNHNTREQGLRVMLNDIQSALEADRQLDDLVETTEVASMTPMVFPGFERSNGQLVVACRFQWDIPAAYATSGDGQLDKSWDDIMTALHTEIAKVTDFSQIYYSDRGITTPLPLAYVILTGVETEPLTTQKSINKLTIDIPIFAQNSDITTGEELGLYYAGRVVEEIGDDPRLGGLIEAVESVTMVPNWAGQNGYERSVIAVRLVAEAVR